MPRSRVIGTIVALGTTLALLDGYAAAVPTVAITSPSEGATISSSAPQVELSGSVAFDQPVASSKRFYLRRAACGGTAPQGLRLSLVPGTDGGTRCGPDGGWNLVGTADEAGYALTFPAADGLPFSLDVARPLTAKIVADGYRGSVNNNPVAVAA